LNFYTFLALREATPVLLLGLIYAGILLALRSGADELAGALCAVACYRWEVGGPFLVLVLLHVLYERRTRVLAGFGMLAFFLIALSLFLYPGWVVPFLRATVNNLRADFGYSIQNVFRNLWPTFGGHLAFGLRIVLLISLGYEIIRARGSNFRYFYWVSALSIAIAPLLGFRTEMENLVVLLLPLAFIFAIIYERWRRIGGFLVYIILILVLAGPWAIYFFMHPGYGKIAEDTLFLFYPIITVIGVYWIRWWAIRPPRTWFDRARL
jgi:type IV secretory pathway VirB2 component (pilin)